MAILLASDLHLAPERSERITDFLAWLQGPAREAEAVFLLGDFFDYWLGDDMLDLEPYRRIASSIRQVTAEGIPVYLQHGNRDFLLGDRFLAATGIKLLPEIITLNWYQIPTTLLHGDLLCTDDTDYQAFRQQVRTEAWQARFLAQPLTQRQAWLTAVQLKNKEAKDAKVLLDEEVMDANPQAIEQMFLTTKAQRIIHGHTHRPGKHVHWVAGTLLERFVLADWYRQASYLRVEENGCYNQIFP